MEKLNNHPIFDMLEPDARKVVRDSLSDSVELSKAISLKRIANALSSVIESPKEASQFVHDLICDGVNNGIQCFFEDTAANEEKPFGDKAKQ